MELISRKQAKDQGLRHYYTGVPCKRGNHITTRSVSSSTCSECIRENHYTYYAKHREQALRTIKNWQTEHNDRVAELSRTYRAANVDAATATAKRYYYANRGKKLHANRMWRALNKARVQHYNVKRRAIIGQATPVWADIDKIVLTYKQSVHLTETTGIKHHVDHIVPLQGSNVCGLHVHWNLQVLTGEENMRKGNKHD